MRVGWVELVRKDKTMLFRATTAGLRVVEHDRLPAVVMPISRWAKVAVEQLTGVIFRGRDLTLIGASRVAELESEGSLVVLPKPVESPVPPVQEDILGALLEEDETYVRCEFSATRWTTDQYALAEVHGDYIAGIPESAPEALRHRILETTTGTGGTGGEAPPAGVCNGWAIRRAEDNPRQFQRPRLGCRRRCSSASAGGRAAGGPVLGGHSFDVRLRGAIRGVAAADERSRGQRSKDRHPVGRFA